MFLWMSSHNSKVRVFGHLNRRDFHLFQQRLRNGSRQNLLMKEPEINCKKLKYDKNVSVALQMVKLTNLIYRLVAERVPEIRFSGRVPRISRKMPIRQVFKVKCTNGDVELRKSIKYGKKFDKK